MRWMDDTRLRIGRVYGRFVRVQNQELSLAYFGNQEDNADAMRFKCSSMLCMLLCSRVYSVTADLECRRLLWGYFVWSMCARFQSWRGAKPSYVFIGLCVSGRLYFLVEGVSSGFDVEDLEYCMVRCDARDGV
jgi:hypothetical protein